MKRMPIAQLSLFVFLGVISRLLPHPPNMAPITAMALFGGVYLEKRYALTLPLLSMILSDIFLGFHSTMPFVYGSFLLAGLIGLWLRTHKTFKSILIGTALASVFFFLITNFGVWLMGDMYPKSLLGLWESYLMGIPFFRNTFIGDFLYTGLFFGVYETFFLLLMKKRMENA